MPRTPASAPQWRNGQWKVYATVPGALGQPSTRRWIPLGGAELTADQARAEAAATVALMRDRGARIVSLTAAPPGETFRAWQERWLADRRARGLSSVRGDESRMRTHVLPAFGDTEARAVTVAQLEDLVSALDARVRAGRMSWKHACHVWGLVTKAFDDMKASKNRALRARLDNPTRDVRGPDRGTRKGKQYLYPSEFLALVSSDTTPVHWARLYAVAVYLYARAGEIGALSFDDVDLEHGTVYVHRALDRDTKAEKDTKTGETRRVPIEPELLPLLRGMHREAGGKGRVFVPFPDPNDHAARLREHLDRAGVTRAELHAGDTTRRAMTFHDLRATGITWCAVRGDDPLRIKQRAGHRTFSTTEQYIREAENLRAAFGVPFPPLPARIVPASVPVRARARGFLVRAVGVEPTRLPTGS